ncbi:MAG: ABC transporter permease [Anaerolineae bacterium]|nr:ABC transporter permease [Anaerolineae bacterium]
MNVQESLRTAITSLAANKLRSFLTMLGIIIGVAAVIAMLSIGRGAQEAITSQITSMGTNLLFVRPGAASQGGVRQAQGSAATLTYEDALALAQAPSVAAVAPEASTFGQVVYLSNNINTQITGVTPEYEQVRNMPVESGSFITAQHIAARSPVAVIGANVAADLFNGDEPLDKTIRINGQNFRVIGVLKAKGGTGFGITDDRILIPLTTLQSRLASSGRFRGGNTIQTINVQVVNAKVTDQAIEEIGAILRERHNILYEDDFTITSQQDTIEAANQITGILTVFLGGIAAISLLVGGIGIMNIMLVSVTERTREIGLRKAVGARKRDILAQFLTEATLLSVAGGLAGILVGYGISRFITGINLGNTQISAVVSADSVLLATLFSVAVGLFFGIFPAQRAADLNPIEALRYE